jgi:hypothetical protein
MMLPLTVTRSVIWPASRIAVKKREEGIADDPGHARPEGHARQVAERPDLAGHQLERGMVDVATRMWIYDIRLVPAGSVRAASSASGRRVDRNLVRTGWFPAALFQRLAIEPA